MSEQQAEPTDDQRHYHDSKIAAIMARWRAGELSLDGKRRAIAAENLEFYRGPARSPVTGHMLTTPPRGSDPLAGLLADTAGVPLDCARTALAALRRAHYEAGEHASSAAEAKEMTDAGWRGYRDMLATGRTDGTR